MKTYEKAELRAILGEQNDCGFLLGKSSGREFVETPWGSRPRVDSGTGEFLKWDCRDKNPPSLDSRESMCFALKPTWRDEPNQGWYMIQACPAHAGKLTVTAFQDVLPKYEPSDPIEDSPKLLIVNSKSYRDRVGEEWAQIKALLDKNWTITLVQSERRFPDHTFVVLEKSASANEL